MRLKPKNKHCYYCGRVLIDSIITKEHIVPRSQKRYAPNNTVWACRTCNQAKGDISVEEFRKTQYYKFHCTGRWRGYKPTINLT